MGLEEVEPTEEGDMELDGALVGVWEHFPDENDPDDFYEEVCFFAKSPNQHALAQEALVLCRDVRIPPHQRRV